jgi:hypothetical protein
MNVEFLKRVGLTLNEMLISESERILNELEKAGNHKLKVNLSVALDTSTPIPYAGVKIRSAPQAVTDTRAILGEDPNQPGLPLGESGAIDPSAEDRMGEKPVVVKRKRGRPEGSKNKKKPAVVEPVAETKSTNDQELTVMENEVQSGQDPEDFETDTE